MTRPCLLFRVLLVAFSAPLLRAQVPLPGTQSLTWEGDLSARMVAGIGGYLDGLATGVAAERAARWQPDSSTAEAWERSVAPNRARLARMDGVVDARVPSPQLEPVATGSLSALVAETDRFTVHAVRWPVFAGVWGEGLLLQPKGPVRARIVALPDADQTPEQVAGLSPGEAPRRQFARRLAESGCEVLVPALIDRADTWSGNPELNRRTNQPHREWIYRQAFALGRHVIGYEVQQVMAAVDCLLARSGADGSRIGVAGWGEGGLIAFHAAALDPRIAATVVSGYFGPREGVAREPIYRNLFGLLTEFGDAELARLVVPRALVIEASRGPEVAGPPEPRNGLAGAAPGRLTTASLDAIRAEVSRAQRLAGPFASAIGLVEPDAAREPWSDATLERLVRALAGPEAAVGVPGEAPRDLRREFSPSARQARIVRQWREFSQGLVPATHGVREQFLWRKVPVTTPEAWREAMAPYRAQFRDEVIGRVEVPRGPLTVRSRPLPAHAAWHGHEVVIDVAPGVFAWGYLLLPKDLKPGERRPVVVAQHGLEGLPADLIDEEKAGRPFGTYKAFATRLAERGFVVFAPHNPYRGDFRELQRRAHPLGKSLFAVITAQHERILDWLETLPWVDPARMGFYGLSYGGSTAMRVPALIERYAVTVCSGNFNEWVWKLVTTEWPGSYVFTKEYEMPEFNLGRTFGHAEMAALIAPRPFMVERGHDDGVGTDEWVGFEYAKVNRLYSRLGIPERTRIEFFRGPHTINGEGSYAFLHQHLRWPEPAGKVP